MGVRARTVIAVEEGPAPLFLRIARAVSEDVRRGRLRAGEALPGSRALASSLGVNRNTVVAAYRELVAQGWALPRPGGGTFVADVPEPAGRSSPRLARNEHVAAAPAYALRPQPEPRMPTFAADTLFMAAGVPDVRLIERSLLARAVRRVLARPGSVSALSYGEPHGDPMLRSALAELVRETRGVPASTENVFVTSGSQMALVLVALSLVRSGDAVAVEAVGYRPAWDAFRRAGARLVAVPVDAEGLDVRALRTIARRERLRAVYVTPHHQYPTTVTLSPARRLALLEIARRERFAVVEDDYDHELHYEGRPVLPVASADSAGSVVYVGTLSKVLAPGLRLGYVVAPPAVVDALAAQRAVIDRQGDHVVERAAAELLEDGIVMRHIRRTRRIYAERREFLIQELSRKLGALVEVTPPAGGLALWVRVHAQAAVVTQWERRALEHKVAFLAGRRFTFDASEVPYVRLGFAALTIEELREAVARLARSFASKKS